MEGALRSLLSQDYPCFVPVLVTAEENEPAAELVGRLKQDFSALRHDPKMAEFCDSIYTLEDGILHCRQRNLPQMPDTISHNLLHAPCQCGGRGRRGQNGHFTRVYCRA